MVLSFYVGFRVVVEVFSVVALVLSLIQLHHDRRKGLWSKEDWVTHNVFRKVAIVASVIEICANIDFLGVFGIYPVQARIFFKTVNLTVLSAAMLTYVYYTAKSCFPFVFASKLQTASNRLKAAVFVFHFVGNLCYCVNAIFSNRSALIIINVTFSLVLSSTIVGSLVLLQRIHALLTESPEGSKKRELQRHMNRWRKFTILFSLTIFVVLVQSLTELFAVIENNGGQPLLPIDEKNFVDPNSINAFGASECSLITAGVVSIYLFIWRAWLTKNGESRMDSKVPGSTDSNTGKRGSGSGTSTGTSAGTGPLKNARLAFKTTSCSSPYDSRLKTHLQVDIQNVDNETPRHVRNNACVHTNSIQTQTENHNDSLCTDTFQNPEIV